PQVALTMPVIEGIDGRSRMSKSTGNYIGIDESPRQMFGKIMSIPDNLIIKYFTLLTDYTVDELEEIKAKFNDNDFNPMELKKDLGEYIVSTYHSKDDAQNARSEFEKVFSKNELPDDINEINLNEEESELRLFKLLSRYNFTSSNGQAKRLMKQGGVKVNDKTIKDLQYTLDKNTETIVKVGKKRFVKFITS
ncbi:MAG TPA: tyrosine--tRNA ligase, partial [bacterium]|nr:tyrosine--tRNA ligase [bacterium]